MALIANKTRNVVTPKLITNFSLRDKFWYLPIIISIKNMFFLLFIHSVNYNTALLTSGDPSTRLVAVFIQFAFQNLYSIFKSTYLGNNLYSVVVFPMSLIVKFLNVSVLNKFFPESMKVSLFSFTV